MRQADTCPSCGTRHQEWENDHNAYVGEIVRCRGCEVKQRTEAALAGMPENELGRGVHVALVRRRS
ncbi:hypothetical protein BAY59_10740 [Prauserella coralliicola]|nr:hypothetical protein BAY59_10740 [Prauserella coralliicola]